MCGICGIYFKKSSADKLLDLGKRALQTLNHRGPDDEGYYNDDQLFLGHKRLSIIDVSPNGHQPMVSNDGNIITIFNGELYNYNEYRELLLQKGYVFKGHSDTEIIPNLYQEYGIEFIQFIKGIFAIALYDKQKNELFLIRDRIGIKPLYYYENDTYLSLASELKAILADEDIKPEIDHQAIYDYLSLSYIPEPATGFKGIYSLLPGHYLKCANGKVSIQRYEEENTAVEMYATPQEAAKQLKNIISNSVSKQLMSDVPIGTFLSGGIDSSLVTAFSAIASDKKVNSFTVKFPDQAFDESYYAKLMAESAGTIYNELNIEQGQVSAAQLKDILIHFDQPFGDSSAIPMHLISCMIRDKITVALSGDGGDEFFCGYEVSWRFPFVLKLKKIPLPIRKLLVAGIYPLRYLSSSRYRQYKKLVQLTFNEEHIILQNFFSYLNEKDKDELYIAGFRAIKNVVPTTRLFKEIFQKYGSEGSVEAYNKRYSLPGDMLKKVDMMSMKASIEVRVPLLYEDVIACSRKIPKEWKYKFGHGKLMLRDLLATMAPDEVVNKKKWGFGIPLDKALAPDAMDFIRHTLSADDALIYHFIKKEVVGKWLDMFFTGTNDQLSISRIGLYQRIYMLLSLELWLQHYKPAIS
ncbi:MAG: asparagine synthase (glutamine-hydrolyzing) [Taibaiella sp.]|nr:asparagine synthase (glutamine-hydrolyzing) [Taibaiella sp.]